MSLFHKQWRPSEQDFGYVELEDLDGTTATLKKAGEEEIIQETSAVGGFFLFRQIPKGYYTIHIEG